MSEIVSEEPHDGDTLHKEPDNVQPDDEQIVDEKPTIESLSSEQSITEESTNEQPAIEQCVMDQSTMEQSSMDPSDMDQTDTDQHPMEQSSKDHPCNEQSGIDPPSNTTDDDLLEPLRDIAKSGHVEIQWDDLQRSLKSRLEHVIEIYQNQKDCKENQLDEPNVEKFNLDYSREEIIELISAFTEPPFTIQRICELLSWPLKYYDRVSTFLRGLERNLRVISSNDWPKCETTKSENV